MSFREFLQLSWLILKLLFSLVVQFFPLLQWRFRRHLPALFLLIGIIIFGSLNLYLLEKRSQPSVAFVNVLLDRPLTTETVSITKNQAATLQKNYQLLIDLGVKSRDLYLNMSQIEKILGNEPAAETYFSQAQAIDSNLSE